MKVEMGTRYGSRVIIRDFSGSKDGKHTFVFCRCDCGSEDWVRLDKLKSGGATQCKSCRSKSNNLKHGAARRGMKHPRSYRAWIDMRVRLKRDPHYQNLDCFEDWLVYENFLRDMGEPDFEYLELERIDNTKGYYPDNCKWATRKEQMNNTSVNRKITFNGETKTVQQWAESIGVLVNTITTRIDRGVPIKVALTMQRMPEGAAGIRFRASGFQDKK